MTDKFNMLVAGLTGQGVLLISRILASALLAEGERVLTADVPPGTHRLSGMYSYIRWGSKVHARLVPEGEADLVVGLEPVECLRIGLRFSNENTAIIMNERPILRMLFIPEVQESHGLSYPSLEEIKSYFRKAGICKLKNFNASEVATKETGTILTMNIVMLGAAYATGMIPVRAETIENCIMAFAPKKMQETNLKAFKAGYRIFNGN